MLRLLIVIAALIGALLEVLDSTITSVAIPQMMGNLGATLSEIGWVTTGYIISNVIILPLTGWLADLFGRKRFFAWSIALFTVASIFCGLSSNLWMLVFWRIIQGIGGGALMATGQVILLDAFPEEQKGVATAIYGMGVMIGPLLGPVLGGYLIDNYAWPAIFLVNIPFGVLAIILTALYVPNAKHQNNVSKQSIDYLGLALLIVGMGSLQAVLERGQAEDWWSSNLIIFLTGSAIVGLIGFIWWELRTKHPVLDVRLFRIRSLSAGSLFGFVLGVGLYGIAFMLPVYLQNILGYSAYETGLIQLPPTLFSVLSFMLAGALNSRVGSRPLLLLGTFLIIFGTALLSILTSQSSGDDIAKGLYFRSLSMGFLFIPLTIASLSELEPHQMGAGSGIINLSRQLGGSFGIAILSTLFEQRTTLHRSQLICNITSGNPVVTATVQSYQHLFYHADAGIAKAHSMAFTLIDAQLQREAMMLSFNDIFLIIAAAFVVALPFAYMATGNKSKLNKTMPLH